MIVDHRTYAVKPGSLPTFLKIYEEQGWPLQQKHLGNCLVAVVDLLLVHIEQLDRLA